MKDVISNISDPNRELNHFTNKGEEAVRKVAENACFNTAEFFNNWTLNTTIYHWDLDLKK